MLDRKFKNKRAKNTPVSSSSLTENANLATGPSVSTDLGPGWTLEPEESETHSDSMLNHEMPDKDPWYKH